MVPNVKWSVWGLDLLDSKDIAESLEKSSFPLHSFLDDELFDLFPVRPIHAHR